MQLGNNVKIQPCNTPGLHMAVLSDLNGILSILRESVYSLVAFCNQIKKDYLIYQHEKGAPPVL